jgi:hypothetical protein
MPGVYRLDVPDAALATGVNAVVVMLKGAANMAPCVLELELTGIDNQNATTAGLVNLDAAITSRLAPTVAARTLDVSATGEAGIDWANIGSPTTAVGLSGTTVKTATDVETDTADIQTRLPAALVSGRMDSSVGAMAANVMTAAAAAADLTTELQTGLSTLTAAGVRSAIGLASANLDTQLTTIDDFLDTEVAAIKAKTDNLPAAPAAVGDIPTAVQNADALLKRDMSVVTGEAARSLLNAIRFLRNKWSVSGATLTVTKEDDTTAAWTATLATDAAADPVVGSDPT